MEIFEYFNSQEISYFEPGASSYSHKGGAQKREQELIGKGSTKVRRRDLSRYKKSTSQKS
jgi:hypothetical protein